MEEMENPVEYVQEELHHHAQHAQNNWISRVALTSALLAALAAVCSLLASHHANEAVIEQIEASDQWGYYQAKGIKAAILEARTELFQALGRTPPAEHGDKFSDYKDQQSEIQAKAQEKEESSRKHLKRHENFARGVTLFQLAIAIAAITVLSMRKRFWYVSLGFGAAGFVFLLIGILS